MPSCDDKACWRMARKALGLAKVVNDNSDKNDAAGSLRWCDLEFMKIAVETASFDS